MPITFQQAYRQLNKNQKIAVNAIEGPVMVIAGPGTGKTQILTLRIANILAQTDTDPQNILALTFTDAAAHNMRQRLLGFIGHASYKVNISTFHAFASSLIHEYSDYFNNLPSGNPLDDITRIQIIEDILNKNQFRRLKPLNTPHYHLSAILSSISTLKREAVMPKDLSAVLKQNAKQLAGEKDALTKAEFIKKEKQIHKNLELVQIYKKYQKKLIVLNRYDYEDMINWVRNALADNQDFSQIIQERYQYLLVDEYQDTNNSQNQIINLLASFWGRSANIFVVGDDEQSIFRFQGASLENIINFSKSYPNAQIIALTDNYRSQQSILTAAQTVISHNKSSLKNHLPRINRHLVSQVNLPARKIKVIIAPTQLEENLFLIKQLKHLLANEASLGEIAIILRNNADAFSISEALTRSNLPHYLSAGSNLLDSPPLQYLITLFRVINNLSTNQEGLDLFTLLNYPFTGLDYLSVLKLSRLANKNRTTILDLALKDKTKIGNYIKKITKLNQQESELTFIKFTELALKKSGLLNWLVNQKNTDYLLNINIFFNFLKNLNQTHKNLRLNQFLDILRSIIENNLNIPSPVNTTSSNKITLITAHKAKGQEWDFVFIPNCINGKWGGQRLRNLISLPSEILVNKQDHNPLEDERRLFYVALTRARKQVCITSAATYLSQGKLRPALPSQFTEEIPRQYKISKKINYPLDRLNKFFIKSITPAKTNLTNREKEFIDSILTDFRLSVTALNTYLDCPYKFKLNNLYRLPGAKKPYLAFGTAVHKALEKFHKKYQADNSLPSKEYLLSQFESALTQEVLTAGEFRERLAQGKEFLTKYLKFHQADLKPALFLEKFFGTTTSPLVLGDISLTGKIDRIDIVDSKNKTIKVIDYKTGKKKTRGQIEGATADQNGALKRQLVFYKLLVSLDSAFPYKVTHAELDFIQSPAETGKSGREVFSITDEDVHELKQIIKKTYKKIKNHQFDRTTNLNLCPRCEFKNHCWPDKTILQNIQGK